MANMETVAEQIEYGTRCVHGHNVGTPGGADLMCPLCEDGYTKWVEDPSYSLAFTFGDLDEWATRQAALEGYVSWRESEDIDEGMARLRRQVESVFDIDGFEDMMHKFRWQFVKVHNGYWTQP